MKPILFSILFLLVPKLAISQISDNDKMIYLDSTHSETKSKDFKYYRIIKDYHSEKKLYEIKDYYKSGSLQMEGTSKTKDYVSKEGKFIFYYENGNKKLEGEYIEVEKRITQQKKEPFWDTNDYVQRVVEGNDFFEYIHYTNDLAVTRSKISAADYTKQRATSPKRLNVHHIESKKFFKQQKINQFWDANGVQRVIDGNGFFEDIGENELIKGEIKNGLKEGTWESSSKKFNYGYKEIYKNGELISGVSTDKFGKSFHYTEIGVKPEPEKGMYDFYKFIDKNYKIPATMPKGIKGKIYLTFVVEKDGSIVETNVQKDLGYGTGIEAIRVLNDYGKFKPAELRGQKIRYTYTFPLLIQNPYSNKSNL